MSTSPSLVKGCCVRISILLHPFVGQWLKTVKFSSEGGWPRYRLCFSELSKDRQAKAPCANAAIVFIVILSLRTVTPFQVGNIPSHEVFPTGQRGALDSMRVNRVSLSLSHSPLPSPPQSSASVTLLCIVLLHQGTYDLWAHLSAIIKQSLMKSGKVTSLCVHARACAQPEASSWHVHTYLQRLHK